MSRQIGAFDPVRHVASFARGLDRLRAARRAGRAPAGGTLPYCYLARSAVPLIRRGLDAEVLFGHLGEEVDPALDPQPVAASLFKAAGVEAASGPLDKSLSDLSERIERASGAPGVGRGIRTLLDQAVVAADPRRPLRVGRTLAVQLEATRPIPDLEAPPGVERVRCDVLLEGEELGQLEFPAFEGTVPAYVLADRIADRWAWTILGRFLERTLYPGLEISEGPDGRSVARGGLALTSGVGPGTDALHDAVGWTVFLQEVWGRPAWAGSAFYDPLLGDGDGDGDPGAAAAAASASVEVADALPPIVAGEGGAARVVASVGGAAIGGVEVAGTGTGPMIPVQAVRAAVTSATGFELCVAAVRQGVLGRPLGEPPASLRERLLQAARERSSEPPAPDAGLRLGRRRPFVFGTSASRRAALPEAAAADLHEAARLSGEPWEETAGATRRGVLYSPELVPEPLPGPVLSGDAGKPIPVPPAATLRGTFEPVFAAKADPWGYVSPYERRKYDQTLEILGDRPIGRALELACAEGHFTRRLAPRVGTLLATDISRIALGRAAERCAGLSNVSFARLDLVSDPLPGGLDLLLCCEVLYYVDDAAVLARVARRLADALARGGWLVLAHANLVVDEPGETGFDWPHPHGAKGIGEVFSRVPGLRLLREIRTPLYRVQLYEKGAAATGAAGVAAEAAVGDFEMPEPEVASRIRWGGGSPGPREADEERRAWRLPILMYHRVAPAGSDALARYRVAPEEFEEQLAYLREAGYHSVDLGAWAAAAYDRRPLRGRPIVLTFDDGYADFGTYAWPLLKRWGFTAYVFLAGAHVGGTNAWDRAYGEELSLLGWDAIRRLRREGVAFGSHGWSHRPLTGMAPEEAAREMARSRATLIRELGAPVEAIAYPYGAADEVVAHLAGASGHAQGLTTRPGTAGFADLPLSLPRREVVGAAGFEMFVRGLA